VLVETTRNWFAADVELRSRLAVESARQSLAANWSTDRARLMETLIDITRDERIMGAAACSDAGGLLAATDSYPSEFSCRSVMERMRAETSPDATSWSMTAELPSGRIHISAIGIEAITPRGLRAAGRDFEFDMLVLATGFDAMTGTLMRLNLRGRGGVTIQHKWAGGPLNYLGLTIAGFPNLFNIAGPGSTSAFTNVIVSIEHHVDWIAECIGQMDRDGLATIDATPAAEAAWVAHVNAVAATTVFLSCNSWYLGANIPGKARMFMPLLGFPAYAERCAEVARNGYEGFVLG
jgi:hypothetical protein